MTASKWWQHFSILGELFLEVWMEPNSSLFAAELIFYLVLVFILRWKCLIVLVTF